MNTAHVVILGGGFGGLNAARQLASAPIRITLIDRQNYQLFKPLLYQVAIARLPSEIAYPLRTIYRKHKNLTFQMGEVTGVNFEQRYVKLDGAHFVLAPDEIAVSNPVGTANNNLSHCGEILFYIFRCKIIT